MSNRPKQDRRMRAFARRIATELLEFERNPEYKLPFGRRHEINALQRELCLEVTPAMHNDRDLATLASYQIPDEIKAVAGFPADLAASVQVESGTYIPPVLFDGPMTMPETLARAENEADFALEDRYDPDPTDQVYERCTCSLEERSCCADRTCPNSTDWDDDPMDPGYP